MEPTTFQPRAGVSSRTVCAAALLWICLSGHSAAEDRTAVDAILESHCVHCHEAADPSSDVDLTKLLAHPQAGAAEMELWRRVERMVARGDMPPQDEEPLSAAQRGQVVSWYRQQYILRNGQPHIGVTPLRRLTRYELQNTLEQLLYVPLKRPYVVSTEADGFQPSTIEQIYPPDEPGESGFTNDAERLSEVKIPILKYIQCVDYALRAFDQNETARARVLGFQNRSTVIDETEAAEILNRFMDRSGRGYRNPTERERVLAVWTSKVDSLGSYKALLRAIRAALLSPSFLYRLEEVNNESEPYEITDHELAVRLSYFLWSSMPDEKLARVAGEGKLRDEAVLRGQLQRMLDSPRRIALSENFAGQWLGFDEIKTNKAYYRGESWTRGVYDELLFGFDELIKSNRSILEIVDSDWAYLRSAGIVGGRARRSKLPETYQDIFADRRSRTGLKVERFYSPPQLYQFESERVGGIITAAGIMRLTSAPNRTNPIRRGVWLLANIIGEEMHPPENIPPLAESEKKLAANQQASSPAEILKVHTSQDSCRACHQHIDPLGLGLENFSPTGDWRTSYPDRTPIPSQGQLPNGKKFESPKRLKSELLDYYRDRIVDNIIRKMLSYALGRAIQPHDRVAIDKIRDELSENNFAMGTLIEQIVLSQQFRCRQDKP